MHNIKIHFNKTKEKIHDQTVTLIIFVSNIYFTCFQGLDGYFLTTPKNFGLYFYHF